METLIIKSSYELIIYVYYPISAIPEISKVSLNLLILIVRIQGYQTVIWLYVHRMNCQMPLSTCKISQWPVWPRTFETLRSFGTKSTHFETKKKKWKCVKSGNNLTHFEKNRCALLVYINITEYDVHYF